MQEREPRRGRRNPPTAWRRVARVRSVTRLMQHWPELAGLLLRATAHASARSPFERPWLASRPSMQCVAEDCEAL